MKRIFTVDVEEWFNIIDCPGAPQIESWDAQQSRVEANTDVILQLMADAGVKGTFFILGWVAERHKKMVKTISEQGHEIASHGQSHRLIGDLGPEGFERDVVESKALLEDASGTEVLGYRAPGFSLTSKTLWALDILIKSGYQYDASTLIGRHSHGGLESLPQRDDIKMLSVPTAGIGKFRVTYCGGGYLRLFPLALVQHFAKRDIAAGTPVVYYVHPREIDPDQPRMKIPHWRRFKHYVGLSKNKQKIEKILKGSEFVTARAYFGL